MVAAYQLFLFLTLMVLPKNKYNSWIPNTVTKTNSSLTPIKASSVRAMCTILSHNHPPRQEYLKVFQVSPTLHNTAIGLPTLCP